MMSRWNEGTRCARAAAAAVGEGEEEGEPEKREGPTDRPTCVSPATRNQLVSSSAGSFLKSGNHESLFLMPHAKIRNGDSSTNSFSILALLFSSDSR